MWYLLARRIWPHLFCRCCGLYISATYSQCRIVQCCLSCLPVYSLSWSLMTWDRWYHLTWPYSNPRNLAESVIGKVPLY
jgi:hypothetical protein